VALGRPTEEKRKGIINIDITSETRPFDEMPGGGGTASGKKKEALLTDQIEKKPFFSGFQRGERGRDSVPGCKGQIKRKRSSSTAKEKGHNAEPEHTDKKGWSPRPPTTLGGYEKGRGGFSPAPKKRRSQKTSTKETKFPNTKKGDDATQEKKKKGVTPWGELKSKKACIRELTEARGR